MSAPDFAERLAIAIRNQRRAFAASGRAFLTRDFLEIVRVLDAGRVSPVSVAAEAKLEARRAEREKIPPGTRSKPKPKPKRTAAAIDDAWLDELEKEPANRGIDVRRELGRMQFWCRNHRKIPSRARFVSWLLSPLCERSIQIDGDGLSSAPGRKKPVPPKPPLDGSAPVPGWPMLLRNHVHELSAEEIERYCAGDWAGLPQPLREKIAAQA